MENRIIHTLVQGSPEWLAYRKNYDNASEIGSVRGNSPYKSRNELLKEKFTGIVPEVSARTQAIFDKGHEYENTARPWAEEIIGEELSPITASRVIDGLNLSASYDGTTMMEDVIFEHKTLNSSLAAALQQGEIPEQYKDQMEQQLMVLGAEKCLFMASADDHETMLFSWYYPDQERRAAILAAWHQFHEDIANFQHVEVIPAAVVAPIEDLPALTVELVGQVTKSNLVTFQQSVIDRIAAINTDLKTDDDFATAKKTVKFLDDGEKKLDLVKGQALAQTSSIDELFRTIDALKGEMKSKRLTLAKLVESREKSIKAEIVQGGVTALADHINAINKSLKRVQMPAVQANMAGCIKGLSKIDSVRNAVDTELARAKIEANAIADKIRANLADLDEHAEHAFLFNDLASLVMKAPDDLSNVIKLRISEHAAEQQRKLDAEREKIRKEEEAKAQAVAKAEQDRIAAEELSRLAKEQQSTVTTGRVQIAPPLPPEMMPPPDIPHPMVGKAVDTEGWQLSNEIRKEIGKMKAPNLRLVLHYCQRINGEIKEAA